MSQSEREEGGHLPCPVLETEGLRHSILFFPVDLEAPEFLESKSDEQSTRTRTILREESDFLPVDSIYDPSDGLTARTRRSQDSDASFSAQLFFPHPRAVFSGKLISVAISDAVGKDALRM